jgi:hypothetical protein
MNGPDPLRAFAAGPENCGMEIAHPSVLTGFVIERLLGDIWRIKLRRETLTDDD